MQDQSSVFTMIMGGIDRSDQFRRDAGTDRRLTIALLVIIAVLLVTNGLLGSAVLNQKVLSASPAATAVADTAPHYAYLRPADLNAPPAPESHVHPY
jgi:hypothetical protein